MNKLEIKLQDLPGFARAASLDEIKQNKFVLTPSRYVETEQAEADDEPIKDKIERLTKELYTEFERGREIEELIISRLGSLNAD